MTWNITNPNSIETSCQADQYHVITEWVRQHCHNATHQHAWYIQSNIMSVDVAWHFTNEEDYLLFRLTWSEHCV